MCRKSLWMFLLILQSGIVSPRPPQSQVVEDLYAHQRYDYNAHNKQKDNSGEVISVRITSSVAVGRAGPKNDYKNIASPQGELRNVFSSAPTTPYPTKSTMHEGAIRTVTTEVPPNLIGANIEYLRQLNAKKEAKDHHALDQVHPFQLIHYATERENPSEQHVIEEKKLQSNKTASEPILSPMHFQNQPEDSVAEPSFMNILKLNNRNYNSEIITTPQSFSPIQESEKGGKYKATLSQSDIADSIFDTKTDDSIAASSNESIRTLENEEKTDDLEDVPLARSVPFSPSSKNYIQGLTNKPHGGHTQRGNSASLTTVSFNVLHDTPNQAANYNTPSDTYTRTDQGLSESNKFYEPPKIYSQPAQIYSEPAKFYSEPAKIYSEPAKIYSEPAKVYSEPAKIYSEPAKFYSQPASLHLPPESLPTYTPWQDPSQQTDITSTILNTTPTIVDTLSTSVSTPAPSAQTTIEHHPERNYETDEKLSVMTDGRSHGVQESTTEKCKQDNCKVGYVVEGRQYKKYRVEERTPDGFIVGEYGVVRNEDGALRGVRYTADSDASPRLIYDALMKFLQLK